MSHHKFAKVQYNNLKLCKEQFAITHRTIRLSELIATVACDKTNALFDGDRYYVCIFAKAVTTSPRLLFRGPQHHDPEEAILRLLQHQSEEIGNMVRQAACKSQMSKRQWREPCDHTVRLTGGESKHNVPVGWNSRFVSNSAHSTSGASSAKPVGNEDLPPPYKK